MKLDGNAFRVPTLTGSLIDLIITLEDSPTTDEINKAFKTNSNETLGITMDKIVSSDIINMPFGSLVDGSLTSKIGTGKDNLYKIVSWYDNEMSYVNQLARTLNYIISL